MPNAKHAFPVGRPFAESIGYPSDLLDAIPKCAYEAFCGVTSVSVDARIEPGMRVLDLGCGGGLDSLIAARRVGKHGHVTGVDFSEPMLERARQALTQTGDTNITFCRADAEGVPCDDASFDLVLINGIFNLNPAREAIFAELGRIVRPSGGVRAAELVLTASRLQTAKIDEASWFA